VSGIRFFLAGTLHRPAVAGSGDAEYSGDGTPVRLALWMRRPSLLIQGQGEAYVSRGQAFLPASTDVQRRDRITVASGFLAGTYEVTEIVPAHDDRGRLDHWGVEVRRVRS
jgi:hypothetical protein